jgi:hypothetical protein
MARTARSQAVDSNGPRLVRKSPRTLFTLPAPSLHEQITIRAYELFLEGGGRHGRHVEHWLRAEQELRASETPNPAVETPKPAVKKVGGPRKES